MPPGVRTGSPVPSPAAGSREAGDSQHTGPQDAAGHDAAQPVSRVGEFRRLAEAAVAGQFVMLPRSLGGNDRRLHVRQTLREDHRTRIARDASDAKAKFDKMADSVFSFFRGTALLFYRDMAGEDAEMPTVLALGDVHPENFGVMPDAGDVPIFGVNDFDEAHHAPFTWDLKRGAVGFMLAVEEEGGHGRKRQRKVARRFARGYIEWVRRYADYSIEREGDMRADSAPELIRDLIEGAREDRSEWLADGYLDEYKRGFRSGEELVPISERREEFQQVANRLVEENDIEVPARAAAMQVKDVAIRRGQGTASLGLDRYYLLIEGPAGDGSDDLIIELKQARRSALHGLAVLPSALESDARGERVAHAQAVQLVRGDRFYGSVEFAGTSYMSRERAPYREDIDLDDLSKSEWKDYAEICGGRLAHAHTLSDELGELDHDIEPMILDAAGPPELFVDDIVRFAEEAADRVRRDHEAFRADHELGAYELIDMVFE